MSLKGVELQIAIPKTFDAGKLAEQKQQRIQAMQDYAHVQTEKQAEKSKETVLETEQYKEISKDHDHEQDMQRPKKHNQVKHDEEKKEKTRHPYKGSFVDFSR